MSVSYNFEGKLVLVTGSSSGIGADIALLFAKSGADLVITGRNEQNLSEVAKQCLNASGNKSTVLQVMADITKEEDAKRLVNSAIEKYGRLDVLVNNAGIAWVANITDSNYLENYNKVLETNIVSVVYLTHLCVEHLAKTKGNIINISSIGSVMAIRNLSSYCMPKSALNMFTKCMAVELGEKRIRVNGIIVGFVRTQLTDKINYTKEESERYFDKFNKVYPVGRIGETQDIANTVLFLASDNASFITGSNITADGGHIAANVDV